MVQNNRAIALLALDERGAIEASDRLQLLVHLKHPLVLQACKVSRARRASGDWEPSSASAQLAKRLEPKLGDVAREVSLVFH